VVYLVILILEDMEELGLEANRDFLRFSKEVLENFDEVRIFVILGLE
jgi:hypothetical protein